MRVGFACLWDPQKPATWSYTPWHLRGAMMRIADVVDVGVDVPPHIRKVLKLTHARRRGGRFTTVWQQSWANDAYCRSVLDRNVAAAACDAVLEIQDVAPVSVPYFLYQDMSFDLLLHLRETADLDLFNSLRDSGLRRRRSRQLDVYANAQGVFAMSQWFANSLVEHTGLPKEKVHVVHPGISAAPEVAAPPHRDRPRRRLLFVGRDFRRKAGDVVVAAVRILRDQVDPQIRLTVAGPATWPLDELPEGVDFVGGQGLAEVSRLMRTHDLFVMPSRFEAFGIVFAEALAQGLPCVGRDAFAMPEMIQPGHNGALVRGDDPAELAETIAKTLADDAIYANCSAEAERSRQRWSWDRAAHDVIGVMTGACG